MGSFIRHYNRSSIFPNLNLWRTIADAEHSRYRISTLEKLILRKRIEGDFHSDTRRIRPRPFDRQEHAVEDRFPRSAENLSAARIFFTASQGAASDRRAYLTDLRRPLRCHGMGSLRRLRFALSIHCPDSRVSENQTFRCDGAANSVDRH